MEIAFHMPVLWLLLSLLKGSRQGEHERRVLRHLFEESVYNKLERPVVNESEPINVSFGIILQQIIDVAFTFDTYSRTVRQGDFARLRIAAGCAKRILFLFMSISTF
ncbi:neuronal acetylcholine receptor subunit alpha-7 isoform X1 [Biomphalaria glabrata]|nr:neuronal acetylcholine receptor subunit alpha-7 isoform X1 [Biomphalaria glabrata]